jgi:hypothetical protein
MSVKLPDGWLGLAAVVRHDVDDLGGLVADLRSFYDDLGVQPNWLTHSSRRGRPWAFQEKRLLELSGDRTIWRLYLSSKDDNPAGSCYLHLRDDPKITEFERRWSGVFIHESLGVGPLRTIAALLERRFGLVQAGMMRQRRRPDMEREAVEGGNRAEADPSIVERIEWDAWNWRLSHTRLRRLYPVTIIGSEMWAQLPPMPAFEPVPTIEDLGTCKLLQAWPTLCEPRDPAFLRGTRALREWLWPYTIQNPADHVDNDPSGRG